MARQPQHSVLEEYHREHLPYELSMLAQTYNYLKLDHGWVINNALGESFCIHARNLVDFYRNKNDIHAEHFTGGIFKAKFVFANGASLGNKLYDKLNEQVAHMAKNRTADKAGKVTRQDRDKIMKALRNEEAEFRSRLVEPWRETVSWPASRPSFPKAPSGVSQKVAGKNIVRPK